EPDFVRPRSTFTCRSINSFFSILDYWRKICKLKSLYVLDLIMTVPLTAIFMRYCPIWGSLAYSESDWLNILHTMHTKDGAVSYAEALYQGERVILIRFAYDTELIKKVKKIRGIRWSPDLKAWYIPDSDEYRGMLEASFPDFKNETGMQKAEGLSKDDTLAQ